MKSSSFHSSRASREGEARQTNPVSGQRNTTHIFWQEEIITLIPLLFQIREKHGRGRMGNMSKDRCPLKRER